MLYNVPCPYDRRLRVVHLNLHEEIELDRCPQGHGLWLDQGEMEALIASCDVGTSRQAGEEGAVAQFLAELSGTAASNRRAGRPTETRAASQQNEKER